MYRYEGETVKPSKLESARMATYKQKIFRDIDAILDNYPTAKVSDVIWALEAATEALWRALPAPGATKGGRKIVERQKRYRVA